MGRGRGKGKKQSAIAAREDTTGSGEDEKVPLRRRGRPQKPMKDDFEEEDVIEKMEEEDEDGEDTKILVSSKSSKIQASTEDGRKRKRPSEIKGSDDLVKEDDSVVTKDNATVLINPIGYRQHGSRRKNKPRRAAEVGVECI